MNFIYQNLKKQKQSNDSIFFIFSLQVRYDNKIYLNGCGFGFDNTELKLA